MNFFWVYELPSWEFWLLCVGTAAAIGLGGVWALRDWVGRLHGGHAQNDVVSVYFTSIAVFYGLAVGLFCVATWQSYSDLDGKVGLEAATLGELYRDVSHLPEPARAQMQQDLREYTRNLIDRVWPAQRQGMISTTNDALIGRFYDTLAGFEPAPGRQTAIYGEALRQFNRLIEFRRLRLQSVTVGLPSTMWVLVVLGAIATLACSWFFETKSIKVHLWLTLMLAIVLGMLIHLLAAMDNPFRGELSVSPEAFEITYRDLMAPPAEARPGA